jgi:hypothetical protein
MIPISAGMGAALLVRYRYTDSGIDIPEFGGPMRRFAREGSPMFIIVKRWRMIVTNK